MKAFLLTLLLSLLFLLGNCGKKMANSDLQTQGCTEIYKSIFLSVKDEQGMPVKLDQAYSIRLSSKQKLALNDIDEQGLYVVLNDDFQKQLKDKQEEFRFVGYQNEQIVLDQHYVIGADKCHIYKVSGVEEVVVAQHRHHAELIIQLKKQISTDTLSKAFAQYALKPIKSIDKTTNTWLFSFDQNLVDTKQLLDTLNKSELVEVAQTNKKLNQRN